MSTLFGKNVKVIFFYQLLCDNHLSVLFCCLGIFKDSFKICAGKEPLMLCVSMWAWQVADQWQQATWHLTKPKWSWGLFETEHQCWLNWLSLKKTYRACQTEKRQKEAVDLIVSLTECLFASVLINLKGIYPSFWKIIWAGKVPIRW